MAIAGAVVRWLQDNLGIIGSSEELGMSYELSVSLIISPYDLCILFSLQRSWLHQLGHPMVVILFPPFRGCMHLTGSPVREGRTQFGTQVGLTTAFDGRSRCVTGLFAG